MVLLKSPICRKVVRSGNSVYLVCFLAFYVEFGLLKALSPIFIIGNYFLYMCLFLKYIDMIKDKKILADVLLN